MEKVQQTGEQKKDEKKIQSNVEDKKGYFDPNVPTLLIKKVDKFYTRKYQFKAQIILKKFSQLKIIASDRFISTATKMANFLEESQLAKIVKINTESSYNEGRHVNTVIIEFEKGDKFDEKTQKIELVKN
eukprot:TRINITY_DN3626_c0_g1_i8.p3 TRINITY_DN3626_c0_g1~~TRINITY_DN3626_c0_g1_i8.p3  ORF type:complete len:130 (+),score=38.25 TRINITY_DN3626_c0_g1_i8:185-574(+)